MGELQDKESVAEFRASFRKSLNEALYCDDEAISQARVESLKSSLAAWICQHGWTTPSAQQRIRGQATFIDGSGCECSCVSGEFVSVNK